MDLSEAADELYALLPEDFVTRRNALAAEAKAGGDRELSTRVKKLTKPTAAAWAVNMLVRRDAAQVEQVLDLGAQLRQAQESMAGDELRELGKQRRQLTAAVTRQARSIAADLGQRLGDPVATQVEETLHAAMVDADAAQAVRTGMLVKPLTVTGMEAAAVVESVAVPESLGQTAVRRAPSSSPEKVASSQESPGQEAERPDLTVVEDHTRQVEEAEAELAEGERVLGDAERRLVKAERKVAKREAKALQLRAELDELRRKVADLEQRIEDHEDDLGTAEETRDEREEEVASARAEVDRARKALEALR